MKFYPDEHAISDYNNASVREKLALLKTAAEQYKDYVLANAANNANIIYHAKPAAITATYDWDLIGGLLRQFRSLPDTNHSEKNTKVDFLQKLVEIYSILRTARMPKLDALIASLNAEIQHLNN